MAEDFEEVLRRAKSEYEDEQRRAAWRRDRREDRLDRWSGAPVVVAWLALPVLLVRELMTWRECGAGGGCSGTTTVPDLGNDLAVWVVLLVLAYCVRGVLRWGFDGDRTG